MTNQAVITAGFSDPVFQSQAAFRTLLAALSEPGLPLAITDAIAAPEGLHPATATALLTLADYETPVWLPEALRNGPAGAWLRFHCGSTLTEDPAQAAFAVLDAGVAEPKPSAFDSGSDQFPERSTTIILQCTALEGGDALKLSGPGIESTREIAPQGLRAGFHDEWRDNGALYPLGVDLILTCGEHLIGLPRTTQIEEAA